MNILNCIKPMGQVIIFLSLKGKCSRIILFLFYEHIYRFDSYLHYIILKSFGNRCIDYLPAYSYSLHILRILEPQLKMLSSRHMSVLSFYYL